MPADRSLGRNVHFYDATMPDNALGGLIQNGSVTEANFIDMLGILVITKTPIRVQKRGGTGGGHIVTSTNNKLELGEYDLYCDSCINVTDEPWVLRLVSSNISGGQDERFTNGVRLRDGKCVITGLVNIGVSANDWTAFEAVHIFPLHREEIWLREGLSRWITDMDGGSGDRDRAKVNSLQNGFLVLTHIQQRFDQYQLSVNPDDGYKVVEFGFDSFRLDGGILDEVCRDPNDPHCVSKSLLRWHFRQSVLANMRGAGEPVFEHDFVDEDMVKVISGERYGKERLELEVAARLSGFVNE